MTQRTKETFGIACSEILIFYLSVEATRRFSFKPELKLFTAYACIEKDKNAIKHTWEDIVLFFFFICTNEFIHFSFFFKNIPASWWSLRTCEMLRPLPVLLVKEYSMRRCRRDTNGFSSAPSSLFQEHTPSPVFVEVERKIWGKRELNAGRFYMIPNPLIIQYLQVCTRVWVKH